MIKKKDCYQIEADQAFDLAIITGRLSLDPNASNYHDLYMYMQNSNGVDMFKHWSTREYLQE
tara:strand:+ start:186 stop:371 length:186 start_codon:yes stop_codon:yes gene_type:complete